MQRAGCRVKTRRKPVTIGLDIDNRRTRHAAIHRRARHRGWNVANKARVERHRNNVARAKTWTLALIGGGNFVGNIFAREHCQCLGAGDFHIVIDCRCPHIQSAPENIGEPQNIIHLIGIIRPPRCDNRIVANGGNFFGRNLRVRIRHGKNDWIVSHVAHHFIRHGTFYRQAQKHIGAFQRIGQRACVSVNCMG